MNKLLLALGTLLVVLLAALFAVPPMVDWNSFKGVLEEEASRVLGRDVRVAGGVDLRLLPMPYVQFERISVSDAHGITGAPFVEAKSFRLWLSVPPLLRGALEARRLEVDGAELRLRVGEDGGGNWRTLRLDPTVASWMPAEVAFQSVELTNARITVEGPGRNQIAAFDGITGELSAPQLIGPYKFVGSVGVDAARQPLRVSLSELDQNGTMRVRAQAGGDGGAGMLSLDGAIEDVVNSPKLMGGLTFAGRHAPNGEGGTHELKTNIKADAFGAVFDDISIAFDQGGRPQLLTGTANATWKSKTELSANLSSRWLDLDRITASAPASGPLAVLDKLGAHVGAVGSPFATMRLAFAIDQVTLAGEAVSDVGLDLVLGADGRRIESLRVALPGGSRAHLNGELLGVGEKAGFNGHLLIEGSSRARFLAWAGQGQEALLPADGRDGTFLFDAQITTSPDLVAITDGRLGFDGAPVGLSMSFRRGAGAPLFNLALDGQNLDLARVAPGSLAPEKFVAWLSARGLGFATPSSTRLKVRLDDVRDGDTTWRDVDIDVGLDNGKLAVHRLNAALGTDARVEASGHLGGLGPNLAGSLSGVVAASSRRGQEQLRRLLGAVFGDGLIPERIPGNGPLRLAWRSELGKPGDKATSRVEVDGSLGETTVRVVATSAGGASSWRVQPLTLRASLQTPDVAQAVGEMTRRKPDTAAARTQSPTAGGQLEFVAEGRPDRGLRTHAKFTHAGAAMMLDGIAQLAADDRVGFSGALVLGADRANSLFAPFYPHLAARLASVPFAGRLQLTRDAGGFHFMGDELTLGKVRIAAKFRVVASDTAPLAVDGRIEASQVLLPALVGLISADPQSGAANDFTNPWLERPFALDVLGGPTVKLAIATPRLEGAVGLATGPARFEVTLSADRVGIENLDAAVLGGRLTGAFALTPHITGAEAHGQFALSGGHLDRLGHAGHGGFDGTLTVGGVALSPRALATTMKGKGQITTKGIVLSGIGTEAVATAAMSILSATGEAAKPAEAISAALDAGTLRVVDQRIDLTWADGAVRVGALAVDGPGGRAVNRTTVEVATLAVESDWRLEPAPLTSAAGVMAGRALPPVQLAYVGKLAEVATLERRVALDALDRELTVLKMERDVRELERLRREDEDRVKAERERLRREELARIKAAEDARRISAEPAVMAPAGGTPNQPVSTGAAPAPTEQQAAQPGPVDMSKRNASIPAARPEGAGAPAPALVPVPAPQPAVRRPPQREVWQPFSNSR